MTHFIAIAISATAHKANSYYTLANSYCTFCVEKHYFRPSDIPILGQLRSKTPVISSVGNLQLSVERLQLSASSFLNPRRRWLR